MEICLAMLHEKPVMLALRNGNVYIDEELQPIKYVTEEELMRFEQTINAIPKDSDPGYEALRNAKRSAFIVSLLGRAVGEECVDLLTHLLDHVHFDVLEYLEGTGDHDA
ncbi:MAG: hypothetical protein IK079_01555 [Desulfovibrio sp.]|nr:hypothetical protein [Desulfovibrio sp.]